MARRYLAAGVVAALVAAAGAVVLRHEDGGPGPQRRPAAASAPTSAERIFFAESDHVSSARLNGTALGPATTPLFNRGPEMTAPAWPSPDRHWLLLSDGELVDLTADKPVAPVQAVPFELISGSPDGIPEGAQARLATGFPWADRSRRLVVEFGGRITSVELATGGITPLGQGVLPTGDPVSDGAAYFVLGPAPKLDQRDFFVDYFVPVGAIARMSAGGRPMTLATGSQLAAAMGGSRKASVVASHMAYSEDGSRLAIELALIDGTRRAGAVVVLDRRGGIVGVSPTPYAHGLTWLAWSPKDGSLAFGIALPRGPFNVGASGDSPFLEPQLWRPGAGKARSVFIPTLGNAPLLSACLWAPDGATLLCGDELSWPVLDVSAGKVKVLDRALGRPIAWVPAYAGKARG